MDTRRRRTGRAVALAPLIWLATACAHVQASPASVSWIDEECPEEFTIRGVLTGLGRGAVDSHAQVLFHFRSPDSFLAAEFFPGRMTVIRKDGDATVELAAAPLPRVSAGDIRFAIQRRLWRITLIWDDRVVAHAYDSEMSGGRAGWQAGPGVSVEMRLQGTEPASFTDDFTRSAGETGAWSGLAGDWRVAEIAVATHGKDVGRYSSNAFSWVATAQPRALSTAGYWFWSDYAVEVSVKPEARGAVGLAAYVQDERNYLAFRWTAASPGQPDSGVREIVRVTGGSTKVLSSQAGGYHPKQWYRLRLVACQGTIAAYIDGQPAGAAQDDTFGQGEIGLLGQDCGRVSFDDVRVVGTDGFSEDFTASEPGKWEDAGMAWQTDAQARRRTAAEGEGLTVTGRPDWDGCVFEAGVSPGGATQVGLCFAYRDPGHYSLFRVPTGGGKAGLIRMSGGKPSVIAESPALVPLRKDDRLKVDVRRGRIKAYVGDMLVVAAVDLPAQAGRMGLYAQGGAGASFGGVAVWFPVEEADSPHISEQFSREQTMAGWAQGSSSWRADAMGMQWHSGTFYGDTRLSVELPEASDPFEVLLVMNADGTAPDSGYQLRVSRPPQGPALLELRRCVEVVARATGAWNPESDGRALRFWREGDLVAGSLGEGLAVWYRDPRPLAGLRVGAKSSHPTLSLASAEVASTHAIDCTFAGPPTEWWAARGVWEVAQRWPCDERWSFFGGIKSESPMLWTKRSFSGDLTVEAWLALYMDAVDDQNVGYSHPSDLNLSICTDGKDLSSGYSFLFAAAHNTVTRILRREQVVSETRDVRLINPGRQNNEFHRHWYHLRVEKRGNRIRLFVDGQYAGGYTDPDPLQGGRVALWTWRNGLMVARVRIWYERDVGDAESAAPAVAPESGEHTDTTLPQPTGEWRVSGSSPVTLVCDFEGGSQGWTASADEDSPLLSLDEKARSEGKRSLRITNRVSGGPMDAWCGMKQFDAVHFPILCFDYRIPKGVMVNLYLRTRPGWFVVARSAPIPDEGLFSASTATELAADGQWHTARIDLLMALGGPSSDGKLLIDDLHFRSPDVEYLRSGFGGNHWGSEYHLDDFRLVGAPATSAADAKDVLLRTAAPPHARQSSGLDGLRDYVVGSVAPVGLAVMGAVVADLRLTELRTRRSGLREYRMILGVRNPGRSPASPRFRVVLWSTGRQVAVFDIGTGDRIVITPGRLSRVVADFALDQRVHVSQFTLVPLAGPQTKGR